MTTFGAGATTAGATPAGLDPVGATTDPVSGEAAASLLLDLATKSFPFDSDGRLQSAHPVDQMVAIGWGIERGSMPSAPTVGRDFSPLRRLPSSSPRFAATVRAALLTAVPVAKLLEAGDITIIRVTIDTTTEPGRVIIQPVYRNNRTSRVMTAATRV